MWLFALGLATVAVVGAIAVTDDEPTLDEQARKLFALDPLVPEGYEIEAWDRNGLALHARLRGQASLGSFTLMVWPTDAKARGWFDAEVERLAGRSSDEANKFAGEEFCIEAGDGTRCVGYEGNRSFVGVTTASDGSNTKLDARLLMRTARKHWHRVFG